jgi:hypothetical protein
MTTETVTDETSAEDKHKLHETLRKILALTTSPVEGEAQAAAAMLQKLLTKHNLSIADLERKGKAAPGVREQGHDLGKAAFKWKLDLADGIAEFYYCVPLVDRNRKTVAFIGRPDNVESLTMLYGWVIDQIKAIATTERRVYFDNTKEHIDPLRWQISFGEGAVERLIVRLREMKARQSEDMSRNEDGDVTALALHHASEASDYLEEKFGYRVDGRKTKREQEREDRYQREAEAKDEMRIRCQEAGDMEPFYEAYPYDRPKTELEIAKQKAAGDKWIKEYRAREARNARRRTGSWREGPAIDYRKEEQAGSARKAGREAAGKVNLQPFIGGATDKKKVRG